MKRGGIEQSKRNAGRDELSARVFFKPFPAAVSLRGDRVIKALYSLARKEKRKVFLVGGLLRNLALSEDNGPDYDIVLDGDAGSFARSAARTLRGTSFMLDKKALSFRVVVKGRRKRPTVVIDISLMKDNEIEEDLKERDFTIDALGMDIASVFSESLLACDPTGGLEDAARKRLAVTGGRVFDDDPLRVLRAVRLSQCYGLEITADTRMLMGSRAVLLKGVSVERVRDELIGIFTFPGTAASIELCYWSGIIEAVLPLLAGWGDAGGYDLKAHALRTVEQAELIAGGVLSGGYLASFPKLKGYLCGGIGPVSRVALFKLSALLHDAGKPQTISRDSGRLRFIGHEQKGEGLVKDLLTGLKLSRKAASFISMMAANHHRLFMLAAMENPSARAMAHFFRSASGDNGIMLILLALADARATRGGEDPALLEAAQELLAFYYTAYTRRKPRPLLSGDEIMKEFGVSEGRDVGDIIAKISEGVETGAISSRAGAIAYVNRWRFSGGG